MTLPLRSFRYLCPNGFRMIPDLLGFEQVRRRLGNAGLKPGAYIKAVLDAFDCW